MEVDNTAGTSLFMFNRFRRLPERGVSVGGGARTSVSIMVQNRFPYSTPSEGVRVVQFFSLGPQLQILVHSVEEAKISDARKRPTVRRR